MSEAANVLFAVLRWSETVEDAQVILLPPLHFEKLENCDAVFDRVSCARLIFLVSRLDVGRFLERPVVELQF